MMKHTLLLLSAAVLSWGQLAITGPSTVKQGQTSTYVASGGTPPYTYSMIPGSSGSVNSSTGVYAAPTTVIPASAPNGCQVLPNNHIFNTPMANVPVDTRTNGAGTNNSIWMASMIAALGGNPPGVIYEFDSPLNYVKSTDATTPMVFFYGAPSANYIIPPFPNLRSENGYSLYNYNYDSDHHNIMMTTDDCQAQEVYQVFPAGWAVQCPSGMTPTPPTTCNSQSGQKYKLTDFAMGLGVDAAGMQLYPLHLKISELLAGAINHMVRFDMCPGCRDGGINEWPAQNNTGGTPDTTLMPYGAIMRLKAGYTWPGYDGFCNTTTCHAYVQTLLTQLRTYGMILGDAGTSGAISVMFDRAIDPEMYTQGNLHGAFQEMQTVLKINATNFDFIDVRSLETAQGGSGTDITWGETLYNNPYVTPSNYAIVKVTDSASATAQMSISLQGLAIGIPRGTEVFQAGTAATQMTAWVTGASNTAYTCSLSPSGGANGTVTSGCLYTPPATATGKTITTLTFTATADGTSTATQSIVIFPGGISTQLYFNEGDVADYTDGNGNLWYADLKTGDPALWEDSFSYNGGAQAWTNTNNAPRVYDRKSGFGSDVYHSLHVPNGTYTVTYNFGDEVNAINQANWALDINGIVESPRFDFFTQAGAQYAAFTMQYSATVTDGNLLIVVRNLGVPPTSMNPCCTGLYYNGGRGPSLEGFSIVQTAGPGSAGGASISGSIRISGGVVFK